MDQMQKNLERALEEVAILTEEKKLLKQQIQTLKKELFLEKDKSNPYNKTLPSNTNTDINNILTEADDALSRFTIRTRKEIAKHAKQKQIKG